MRLQRGALHSALCRGRREGAIYDLIDRVDGFSFTGTAAQNKNTGNQLEAGVSGIVLALRLTIFTKDDAGDTNRFPTVSAKDSSKLGGLRNGGHQKAP